jgi:hypothetical protein
VNFNPNLMWAGHYERPASCVTIGALLGYFAYHAALGRAAKQKNSFWKPGIRNTVKNGDPNNGMF